MKFFFEKIVMIIMFIIFVILNLTKSFRILPSKYLFLPFFGLDLAFFAGIPFDNHLDHLELIDSYIFFVHLAKKAIKINYLFVFY